MVEVLGDCSALENIASGGGFVARPEERVLTRFEKRGERLGHIVRDLAFRKRDSIR
jgi:tRNA (guanine-N7-)-methyltransferase